MKPQSSFPSRSRRALGIALAILSTILLLGGGLGIGAWVFHAPIRRLSRQVSDNLRDFLPPTPPPTSGTQTPLAPNQPASQAAHNTESRLRTTHIPELDPIDLTRRMKKIAQVPVVVQTEPRPYRVGDQETFWVSNLETAGNSQIQASLQYITPHLYMWVQQGEPLNLDQLRTAAETFEHQIYVKDREFFGSEWAPGVDSDPHLFVLHAHGLGSSVAGYFSSVDEYSSLVHPFSNGHEMFYINLDAGSIADFGDYYNGVLAHEFQHMIHWHNDPNEESWLNEGFSVLATHLNGFDPGSFDQLFLQHPDTQLNSWPVGPGAAGPNYGAGYLFTAYFLDRFGEQATRALVANPDNGLESIDTVLSQGETWPSPPTSSPIVSARTGEEVGGEGQNLSTSAPPNDLPTTADQVFADWTVANLLDNWVDTDGMEVEPRYRYHSLHLDAPALTDEYRRYPVQMAERTVHQYGTDYLMLRGESPVTLSFSGATQVKVVDNNAHSGRFQFWSNRADSSDMTLTHSFDLSRVSKATLDYWTWYDLESGWDYAYVTASTDGGQTWDILQTGHGTDRNPSGNAYGWGYTGMSGSGEQPQWIQDQVDLSAYAGKTVLVRFEVVTDSEINLQGFAVDDFNLPELNYHADLEADDGGWDAQGFVRLDNILPQQFSVQLVAFTGTQAVVHPLPLDDQQSGRWPIPLAQGAPRAVVVISGLTRATTNPATYRYEITVP